MKREVRVIVSQVPGKIEFNFQEIKDSLSAQMELYKDIQLTEETSAEGKRDITTLRKIIKAINEERIKVKKDCLKPYTEFEIKANELISLIDKPIELIDKQVKVFEEKKKAEKKAKIQELYNGLIGDLTDYLPFIKIYDNKWENTSTSIKSIREEIENVVSSTQMAVQTINDMNSEAVPKALEQYKQNLSLADAISYINRYEQQKAEILRKEEEKRKAEEERKRIAEENRIREQEKQKIIEEERQRKAEEKRIREEERDRFAEENRQAAFKIEKLVIPVNTPVKSFPEVQPFLRDDLEKAFEPEAETEESFDQPFEVEEELPFTTVGEYTAQSVFNITGTPEELEQVEMFLNSLGLAYERKDL